MPIALAVVFGFCAVAMIGIMVYFSCIDTKTDLGSFERIIRFNDIWGTHRGFMWIRSIWIFGDASFIEKLFGVGPDMFYSHSVRTLTTFQNTVTAQQMPPITNI